MAVNLHETQHWVEPYQNFTGSYEKSLEVLDELQDTHRTSKGIKVNKLWQKLFDQN